MSDEKFKPTAKDRETALKLIPTVASFIQHNEEEIKQYKDISLDGNKAQSREELSDGIDNFRENLSILTGIATHYNKTNNGTPITQNDFEMAKHDTIDLLRHIQKEQSLHKEHEQVHEKSFTLTR